MTWTGRRRAAEHDRAGGLLEGLAEAGLRDELAELGLMSAARTRGGVPDGAAKFSAGRIPEEGAKRADTVAALNALKGGTFTNRATGIAARLSSTGAGKLISNKAVSKSLANGFTAQQHNALAARIDSLYESAVLVEERPDRNGDINIRSIRRFVSPVQIGRTEAGAYITVKESVEHGNRIYSVEGIKIEALSPTVRRAIADHNSADNAASLFGSMPNSGGDVNGGAAKFSVSRITPEEDAAYLDAVKRGDMETAQRLLKSAWERSGYSDDTSYKDAHAAPCAPVDAKDFRNAEALLEARDEGWDLNLWAVAKGITGQPDDFFSDSGPRLYGYDDAAGRETQKAVAQTIDLIRTGADNAKIIVYRAVPKSVKLDTLQSGGQWVSPSRTYAEKHGKSRFGIGKYRVIREVVRADELWWDGNDAREWGYDDGRQYVYMNGENGKKLATVTYDGAGNVIPLRERFNPAKGNIKFSVARGEELSASTEKKRAEVNEALDNLERVKKQSGADRTGFYRAVNGVYGAARSFDLGKPEGMLRGHLPDRPVVLKLKTLLRKRSEAYKNRHPFDFAEVTDLVERVHNPAILMKNANGEPGVREFFESASGRAFMVAIRPTGEINDIATLFPKDFDRLVRMVKTADARELLAVDAEKAIKLLRSRSNTASAEVLDDLSDAISVLNSAAGVNGGAKLAAGGGRRVHRGFYAANPIFAVAT